VSNLYVLAMLKSNANQTTKNFVDTAGLALRLFISFPNAFSTSSMKL
jgi:hypothetical protein